MAKQRKPFACPGCEKTVKVPMEHLGRRVKCPKCSSVFRAGPKSLQESEVVYAELDDELDLDSLVPAAVDPQPPLATFVKRAPAAVPQSRLTPVKASTQLGLPPYKSPRAVIPKSSRKNSIEMSEKDTQIQSTGFFLVSVPAIATVLPLFGLQLRRLARLGEFAPLAGMFLGLIGVGCIYYARRNQPDKLIFGSSAAAFVLFAGIGGFILVSTLDDDSKSYGEYQKHQQVRDEMNERIQENIERSQRAYEERQKQFRASAEERRKRQDEELKQRARELTKIRDQMHDRLQRQSKEMTDRARRQIEELNKRHRPRPIKKDDDNPFEEEEIEDLENPFIETDDTDT